MTTTATPLSIYQLRIVLRGISPLIWRRVLVHSNTTLAHLHTILPILFAWSDEHLHSFHIHGKEYGSSGAPTRGAWLRDYGRQPHMTTSFSPLAALLPERTTPDFLYLEAKWA